MCFDEGNNVAKQKLELTASTAYLSVVFELRIRPDSWSSLRLLKCDGREGSEMLKVLLLQNEAMPVT